MKIIFAILLPTLSQAIHCDDGLKLREYTSQCYNRSLLKKPDPKSPRTALASLPGKNYKIVLKQGIPIVDVLWCQPIKLIHIVSTSEFHEY